MTDEFVTDSQSGDQETGGTLRQKLEAALQANKALMEQVNELRSEQSKRAASETWAKLRVPPKLQAAYLGDQTPEAIEKWWSDISGLVNLGDAGEDQQQLEETQEQREQRDQIEAAQRASGLGGEPVTGYEEGFRKAAELRARGSVISKAELNSVFDNLGIK